MLKFAAFCQIARSWNRNSFCAISLLPLRTPRSLLSCSLPLRRSPPLPSPAVHSFVLALDEAQEVVHLRHKLAVVAEDFPGVVQADLRAVEQPMGLGQRLDDVRRKVVPFQPHHVDAAGLGRIALDEHVRRNVVPHGAQPGHKGVAADGGKVVYADGAGKPGMVVDVNVPAQQRAVGDARCGRRAGSRGRCGSSP